MIIIFSWTENGKRVAKITHSDKEALSFANFVFNSNEQKWKTLAEVTLDTDENKDVMVTRIDAEAVPEAKLVSSSPSTPTHRKHKLNDIVTPTVQDSSPHATRMLVIGFLTEEYEDHKVEAYICSHYKLGDHVRSRMAECEIQAYPVEKK